MAGAGARVIGVCGAGTMGRGIAQAAALGGLEVRLHDPVPAALDGAAGRIAADLDRGAQRGRWSAQDAGAAAARVTTAAGLDGLAACELVIEAAPEDLELKQGLFAQLAEVVAPDCVLATNTSSLLVTAVAATTPGPERVVGLHFFNPAPLMRLVELVAGEASGEAALARAQAVGAAMGKRVIRAADVAGFVVNRCNRPFGLESLRLVQERLTTVQQADRICRRAGFRMGPFELMDLVGTDVGLDVSRSIYEQSFGEPRWRPSPLTVRLVAAGRTGRKSGRGWHDYRNGPHRPEDPPPPPPGGGDERLVVIAGWGVLAAELREAAQAAGFDVRDPAEAAGEPPWLILDCGADESDPPLQGGPQAILCAAGSLAALDPEGAAAGFHALPPLAGAAAIEVTRTATTSGLAAERLEAFVTAIGRHAEPVGDAPGLGLGRVVCQLVNEAAFALGEGVASAADIDAGMELGLNHPRGPLAWGDAIGLDHVLAVLDGLADEYGEERYRAAPALRRAVLEGRLGAAVGGGFHAGSGA